MWLNRFTILEKMMPDDMRRGSVKKILLGLFFVGMILAAAGCEKKSENSPDADVPSAPVKAQATESVGNNEGQSVAFNLSINAYSNLNGGRGGALGYVMEVPSDGRVSCFISLSADTGLTDENELPIGILVFADDEPAAVSIDEGEEDYYCEVKVESGVETVFQLDFTVEPSVDTITIITVGLPDYIPSSYRDSIDGTLCYSIKNISENAQEYVLTTDAQDYAKHKATEDNCGIDIGELTIAENDNNISENQVTRNLVLDEKSVLYIKYHEYETAEDTMLLVMLFDGKPIKAWGDQYGKAVTAAGADAVQIEYTGEELEEDVGELTAGMHVIQLIACSIGNHNCEMGYERSTNRILIEWK